MLKNSIVCLLLLCLLGCTSTPTPPIVVDTPIFHPPIPEPVKITPPKWVILTPSTKDVIIQEENAYSYMCLSWEDYLVMGQNMQIIIHGFKEYHTLLCYYRKDLNEIECSTKGDN